MTDRVRLIEYIVLISDSQDEYKGLHNWTE